MAVTQELMKIVGMEEWLIWVGWFLYGLAFSVISYTVVTLMLQYEFSGPNSAAIRNVNPLLLWLFIMVYCVANVVFAFVFAATFHHRRFFHFLEKLARSSRLLTNRFHFQPPSHPPYTFWCSRSSMLVMLT